MTSWLRLISADHLMVVATIAVAYALKHAYSVASPADLGWILRPTVSLVELGTGADFVFEAHEGYLSRDLNLMIAPSCAGVNFLIAALCTGVLGLTHLVRDGGPKVLLLLGVAGVAYGLTVVTNASRLLATIWMTGSAARWPWVATESFHRVEGVVVYFGVLCLSFVLAYRTLEGRVERTAA